MASNSRTAPTAKAPAKDAGAALRVSLPGAKDDRALTGKVGLVAVLGFAVGVAWPRLLGVTVGPDVPGGAGSAGGRPVVPPPSAASAAPVASGSPTAEPEAEPEPGPSNKQQVVVADGNVVSCRNKKNDKVDECGKLGFDKLAKSRLGELDVCPAAIGLKGEMTLLVGVNFEKNEVVVEGEKRKGALPADTARGVIRCAADKLKGLELDKLTHTHPRYTVSYKLSFYPPGEAPPAPVADGEADAAKEAPGLGKATVTNERANLRDAPKEGKIVAKLPQGTRVKLLEQRDDWYLVESKKGKGWVYRQAIGR